MKAKSEPYDNAYTGPSFPLGDRVRRALWQAVWLTLFRLSPRSLHVWRRLLLRTFGARVGKGVHVYPGVRIWAPWNVEFGEECGVGDGAILYSQGFIRIGRRAVISQGSQLCTGTHDYTQAGFPLITTPITIGAETWLAAECFIMPGVRIGDGAVIGARSVVTKDMPAWTVCAGHPCKPIKPRQRLID